MIINGDCIEELKKLPDNSIDTCITDPPYHLTSITKRFGKENSAPAKYGTDGVYARSSAGFMGKTWDGGDVAFNPATWAEVYRVLKPGALLLSFGGTRTYHRMVCAIEDAGFEIRDTIGWVYAQGFPKSYDISKGIDKRAGAEREVVGAGKYANRGRVNGNNQCSVGDSKNSFLTAPATPEAQLWNGWKTSLKPAMELIVVAMKPLDGTYVENALKWGVAGMWIDGGRIEGEYKWRASDSKVEGQIFKNGSFGDKPHELGRYPADLIHDGSDEVLELFPQTGKSRGGRIGNKGSALNMMGTQYEAGDLGYGDEGSAARFFYCAKASRNERNAGLEGANTHATVKPLRLMQYLVRLTKTPTGGIVLDPFMGSGTTGCACALEGREFIGIEKEAEYIEIAKKRIAYWQDKAEEEADEGQ